MARDVAKLPARAGQSGRAGRRQAPPTARPLKGTRPSPGPAPSACSGAPSPGPGPLANFPLPVSGSPSGANDFLSFLKYSLARNFPPLIDFKSSAGLLDEKV